MTALTRQPGSSPEDSKQEARRAAKAARREAAAASPGAGDALARLFLSDIALPSGAVVSGFWPLADEIQTLPLLSALSERGHALCLPVMLGPGRPLIFRAWLPGDELVPAGFGTSEPAEDKAVLTPQVLIVPLLAFDRAGYRLGYGGGFYDRTLQDLRREQTVLAVGIAYAGQECPAVPRDDLDQRLDWIVSERESLRFGDRVS